jgi:hypothetical protein
MLLNLSSGLSSSGLIERAPKLRSNNKRPQASGKLSLKTPNKPSAKSLSLELCKPVSKGSLKGEILMPLAKKSLSYSKKISLSLIAKTPSSRVSIGENLSLTFSDLILLKVTILRSLAFFF